MNITDFQTYAALVGPASVMVATAAYVYKRVLVPIKDAIVEIPPRVTKLEKRDRKRAKLDKARLEDGMAWRSRIEDGISQLQQQVRPPASSTTTHSTVIERVKGSE